MGPKVLYIAGYGRSGSTILDILLSQADSHVGAGELTFLFEAVDGGEDCSCGQKLDVCPTWGSVLDGLGCDSDDVAEAKILSRRLETIPGRTAESGAYKDLWRRTLKTTSDVVGADCVVDSSKTSRRKWRRPLLLDQIDDLDLRVIHLVRDPKDVMQSIEKGSNKALEGRENTRIRGGAYRGLASWTFANTLVETHLGLHDVDRLLVRYEDLMADPATVLNRIGEFADVDVTEGIHRVEKGVPLDPGHGIRGNRLRREGPIRFDPPEEQGPTLPRLAALLGEYAPLRSRYGYD
jgi:hypothetical protein